MGVVMYGMTETGSALANESILNYVDKHMDIAARMFDYSRYDTEKYGFPCVMQQIADIDSLDDCGSFANSVLNYAKEIGEFEAEYSGKMQLYLTALDEQVKLPDENPSIGIVLCKSANRDYVEFVIQDYNKPMGVATYTTSEEMPEKLRTALPDIEELKKLL